MGADPGEWDADEDERCRLTSVSTVRFVMLCGC